MSTERSQSAGHGLIAAFVLAALAGAGGLLAQGELSARWRIQAQARSIAALSHAREALLGYAISYGENHAGQDHGYLPCPDTGNTGSTPPGACGARGLAAIGRLPWRTLSLPQLHDGWGECLWYAVSGNIKNNPKPLALNWDSPGQFRLWRSDGHALPAASPDGLAVALIFAPGPALGHQARSHGGSAPCRSSGSLDEAAAFIESSDGLTAIATPDIRQGQIGDSTRNDLIAWLGVDDIYDALRRRSDFAARIDRIGETAARHLALRLDGEEPERSDFVGRHLYETPLGRLLTGRLPAAAELAIPAPDDGTHDNWRDQFHVALCKDGSACIDFIDAAAPGSASCRAVLLFGGERIREGEGRQQRTTPAQRDDVAQYLEGDNPLNFSLGIAEFHGAPEFRIADPHHPSSQDVVRCLN